MELHELHMGEDRAGLVGDGHAVASGHFGVGGFAIDLAEAASGKKNRGCADLVQRAIGFVDEADADGSAVFKNEAGGERVGAKTKMRNFVRAGEQSTADFASSGIAVRMQDAGAAVCGFASEGKFGATAIEFRTPFHELTNLFKSSFP